MNRREFVKLSVATIAGLSQPPTILKILAAKPKPQIIDTVHAFDEKMQERWARTVFDHVLANMKLTPFMESIECPIRINKEVA